MKKIYFLIFLLINLNLVSATYISGEIYLKENGEAKFNLNTDTPLNIAGLLIENEKITGTTNSLIALKKGIWTFSLELENYDDIFLDIYLPKNLESITKISGADNLIDTENKIITVIDSGKLEFQISYKLKEIKDYSWLIFLIIILIAIIIYKTIKKTKDKKNYFNNIMPLVGDKEEKILSILMKSPKRQKELRKQLNIPKASFTRYISNLEKKKLILREGEGKNKIIKLK